MLPLCEALQQSLRLTDLFLDGNGLSRECARDHILPAVRRSHASLQSISFNQPDFPELVEAEELVRARART